MKTNSLVSAAMMVAMSVGSTGCFLFGGDDDYASYDSGDRSAEIDFEIVSPTKDDVVVGPTSVWIELEPLDEGEGGEPYYDIYCELSVDGEAEFTASTYFDFQTGSWHNTELAWDPMDLDAGEHEISVTCAGIEETATVMVGDALVVASVSGPADDGGAFGGAPEFEVHLYDADGGAWLGCSGGAPTVLRTAEGSPIMPAHVDGMNLRAVVIENDGAGCPAQPTLGDPGLVSDDDDFVSEISFAASDLEAGVTNGNVNLVLGRGY